MKIFLKSMLTIIGVVLLCLLVYAGYFLIAYERIGETTEAENIGASDTPSFSGDTLTLTLWNIGGGVSVSDFSDFTEGGDDTRGASKECVEETLDSIFTLIEQKDPDIILLSEVDELSTRSFSTEQSADLAERFAGFSIYRATLYNSPYILLPFGKPVGYMRNSLVTASRYSVSSCERIPLPVCKASELERYVDADRAYTVSTLTLESGKKLAIYNISLSDEAINEGALAERQLKLLFEDMSKRIEDGDSVICGGDFSSAYESSRLKDLLPEGFSLIFPEKNTKKALPDVSDGLVSDGFIISEDLSLVSISLDNTDFSLSDHACLTIQVKIES